MAIMILIITLGAIYYIIEINNKSKLKMLNEQPDESELKPEEALK